MTTEQTIRASETDRNIKCPGSLVEEKDAPGSTSAEADAGKMAHEYFAAYIVDDEVPNLTEAGEADRKVFWGFRDMWEGKNGLDPIGVYFPNPVVEAELSIDRLLTGHPDLYSIDEDAKTINVLDWKSGWGQSHAPVLAQLKSGAVLVLGNLKLPTESLKQGIATAIAGWTFNLIAAWPRHREWYCWTFNALDLYKRHRTDLESVYTRLDAAQQHDGTLALSAYATGEHCAWCRAVNCPAIKARSGALTVRPFTEMTAAEKIEAVGTVKGIMAKGKQLLDFAKSEVEEHGPIQVGDQRLELVENSPNREMDVLKAWDDLEDLMGALPFRDALRIANRDFEAAIKAKAAKGMMGKDIKAAWELLDKAGAVIMHPKAPTLKITASETKQTKEAGQ